MSGFVKVESKNNLLALEYGLDEEARLFNLWAAYRLLDIALEEVPVDTGFLADSGHVEEMGGGEFSVVFDAEYARFVHFGTRYMPANPWLFRALARMSAEYDAHMEEVLQRIESKGRV